MLEELPIQWLICSKCKEWRSHYPVKNYDRDKPPDWHCPLCGTRFKKPRKQKVIKENHSGSG